MLTMEAKRTLNNGAHMPYLGLGVWPIPKGNATIQAVEWALASGYRHIDTAKFYANEASVGEAIRASSVPREDIWVTTKLFPIDAIRINSAFESSFKKLGLDMIDLYLVHFPPPGLVVQTWKKMEALYATGRIRAIGVSNHKISNLEAIRTHCSIVPAVNQIRLSPYYFNTALVQYCIDHGIAVEAYSPLTRGKRLNDTILAKLARQYSKTTAQILIRWALQHSFIVIPKSQQHERIIENANVYDFEISDRDMDRLDAISK